MPNLTISIPDELKKQMEKLPEINWSQVIREILSEKVKRSLLLKRLDKMLENSELTDEDILKLSKNTKKGRFDELKSKGLI